MTATIHWHEMIASVMHIQGQVLQPLLPEDTSLLLRMNSGVLASARGQLLETSASAYQRLDAQLRPLNAFAIFRESEKGTVIVVASGRPQVQVPRARILPIILLLLTLLSVLFTGTLIAIGEVGLTDAATAAAITADILPNLWRGLPYALSIMLILGGHELGHFLQMRRYRVSSSYPYFLPAFGISPFGTFGAGIVLREPMPNRNVLFDVGATGPWVGFCLSIPILLIGLATSPVVPITGGAVEGNSLVYLLAKILVFGRALPDGTVDVLVNQLAWAGWTGLFVTAINLIPLGQLDGGHVLYSLLGSYARRFFLPFAAIFVFFALFTSSTWAILGVLLIVVGRFYAVPLDDVTPLSPMRQRMALASLVLFGVLFVPVPLAVPGMNDGLLGFLFGSVIIGYTLTRRQFWSFRR